MNTISAASDMHISSNVECESDSSGLLRVHEQITYHVIEGILLPFSVGSSGRIWKIEL